MPAMHNPYPSQGLLRPYSALFRLVDLALIFASFVIAATLQGVPWSVDFTSAALAAILIFIACSHLFGLYNSWRITSLRQELLHVLLIWLVVFFSLLFLAYGLKVSEEFSRRAVITWFFAAPICLCLLRITARSYLTRLRLSGRNQRHAAVIGDGLLAQHICQTLEESPWLGITLDGLYSYELSLNKPQAQEEPPRYHVSGYVTDLVEKARDNRLDMVFIAIPADKHALAEQIVASFADTTVNVYFIPSLFMTDLLNSRWGYLEDVPFLSLHESPFYGIDGTLKRMEDVIFSLFILAIISVPMLLIATGIKLTSKGPVLFKQRRYGLNNQEVLVWKFRTMTVQEDGETIRQACRDDPRVTPFGAFLRRTSLDELPQFFNVLQGRMSIVGPRPHAVAHNEHYRREIYGYTLRHKVKPGITGWAQVNGWRGETDTYNKMRKRIDCDLWYIDHWSFLLDVRIILLTIFSSFVDRRAY